MGLYLCVFENEQHDDELDGLELGAYDDFHALRQCVSEVLEDGEWGSRFPTLMNHGDSFGTWTAEECRCLGEELRAIKTGLGEHPPASYKGWQAEVARTLGYEPGTLAAFFIDVDGEPLLERLIELADLAASGGRPITFM